MRYTAIIEKAGYLSCAPARKGRVSQGATKEDALKNIKEAMDVYVEALLEDGLPVPVEAGKANQAIA
ncbi:MAG: type II toxin-antitoxin system HicB family antitoxin [Chloroflexi bacterium]|nr:type II toxin-antitoxin system HicB family antitoxin [Chloroflexota bacterium]